jgi:hypothetical protein
MHRFIRGGLVALAIMGVSLPTVTRAADVTTWQYAGQSANAQFISTDPSGCITTVVTVAAYDGRIKQDGQPTKESAARVAVQQFDSCTQSPLFFGNNETWVLTDAFQVNQQRTSATLNATINVEEYVSGKTFPVTVNLSWTANGNAVNMHKRYQLSAPGLRIVEHAQGTVQPAVASGTVSVADGPNLTPNAAQNDQVTISSVEQGTVQITR